MTAKALESELPCKLSNSALRSMLSRLCQKRVLRRCKLSGSHAPRDRRIPYVYSPAITDVSVRKRALFQLACDYFDGSLHLLLKTLADELNEEFQPGAVQTGMDVAA